ncbi:MAG: polysaccharide biosynthesis protein, partial [Clostridia bacterium]|nr:polysaccharide biosynthesis protein [Clostridia bacterium]
MLTFICVNFGYLYLSGIAYFSTPVSNLEKYYLNSAVLFICIFMARFIFRTYSYIWRYTNTMAYLKLIVFDLLGGALSATIVRFILGEYYENLYIGVWHAIVVTSVNILLTLTSRFVYRLLYKHYNSKNTDAKAPKKEKANIAIVGAGQLGAYLAGELTGSSKTHYCPKFFIDSDKTKINKFVAGLPVFSSRDSKDLIEKYDIKTVVIAISKVDAKKMEQMWQFYSALGCKVKTFDAPYYTDTEATAKNRVIREFSIEDLLFRKPISVSERESLNYYSGKTVLVTGGGGSIGSEICRQIAKCQPKRLVIIDIYENNAYDIQQELRSVHPELKLTVLIGSVREEARVNAVFAQYKPQIVCHAAA